MHAKIFSATTIGIDAHIVDVEVDLSLGLMKFYIVGLPDKAIKESKDRIRAALKNSGLRLPERLITVNLAPASLKKQDVLFDVPITIALLQAAKLISLCQEFIQETLFLGELALDGTIRPVCGVLPITQDALRFGKKRVIVPHQNAVEASLIQGIEVIGVKKLVDLVGFLRNEKTITSKISQCNDLQKEGDLYSFDFSQVKGQWQAKRALQIAAAGGHNLLFIGPPGSGKTMLAKRFITILPPLSFDEMIKTTKIYSVAGLLYGKSLVVHRPFRSPHHTISQAGLVGGGSCPRPGEISLAHNGVLFLDELTEFKRSTLEVLRQPLEDKKILIARAQGSVEFPASFLLIVALNPCPCGFLGDQQRRCVCSAQQVAHYLAKLSGPLLDRIDLHVSVPSIRYDELKDEGAQSQSSKMLRENVEQAVCRQQNRLGEIRNAFMNSDHIEKFCKRTEAAENMLKQAFSRLGLSMRGYSKVLKIGKTIADLDNSDIITEVHIQEAIMYRSLDRTYIG